MDTINLDDIMSVVSTISPNKLAQLIIGLAYLW